MYSRILVTLDTSPADRPLVAHITELARVHGSSVVLVHVADGWAARHFDTLKLVESEEMKSDRAYLESQARLFEAAGVPAEIMLAHGEPPAEILKAAEQQGCDLIAMATHGHRFLADLVLGSTIDTVRHRARVPLLVINA
ncbi:MAG: universal stress protein [Phycisphaerales bacterium]|nr:universal stress protein [Phycisphaerales bacterium]